MKAVRLKELREHPVFRKEEAWEEVRKFRRPFLHVLDACRLAGQEQDFALVDFHALFTLSVPLVREFAQSAGDRLRLLSPFLSSHRPASVPSKQRHLIPCTPFIHLPAFTDARIPPPFRHRSMAVPDFFDTQLSDGTNLRPTPANTTTATTGAYSRPSRPS